MRRFRIFIAVLLGLLWLPATLHCGLEAAELIGVHCDDGDADACGSAEAGCATDSCQIVEEPGYRGEVDAPNLAPPNLIGVAYVVGLTLTNAVHGPEAPDAPPDGFDRPRDWVPAWAFERRAAAPAQAPNPPIA